ncbi:MAG: hypothetical protein E4G89_05945 [Methanothrix sp.]|nr:MAG: hypothetical protein E4G89_05945 [Methanothrix sp.]
MLSRGHLLDKKIRAESTSLIMEIAEERDPKQRDDRVCFLIELVAMTMPIENLDAQLSLAFKA